jgi:hypothetical protein
MDEIIRYIMEHYKVNEAEARRRFENALKEEAVQKLIKEVIYFHDGYGTDDEAAALIGISVEELKEMQRRR